MDRDFPVMIYVFLRSLLSPPALQILLVLAGLACLHRQRRWWGRGLITLALASLWFMATPWGASLLARGLEGYPPLPLPAALAAGHWQAIVVPGAGRDYAAPEYGGVDVPNVWAASRLRYAALLYRQSGLPIAVSGGAAPGEASATGQAVVAEAAIMAASLQRDYVVNVRWQEGGSATTWENAAKTYALLHPQGVDRIVLVTQALHMPRALLAFRQAGFTVLPAPIDAETDNARLPWLLRLAPRAERLLFSAQACHEYAGLLAYRVRALMN